MRVTKDLASKIAANAVTAAGFHEKEQAMIVEYATISRNLLPAVWESVHQQKMNQKLSWSEIKVMLDTVKSYSYTIGWSGTVSRYGDYSETVKISGVSLVLDLNGEFYHGGQNIISRKNLKSIDGPEYLFPYHTPHKPIIQDESIRERLITLFTEHGKLVSDAQDLELQVEQTCRKFTTIKKLVEAWPEVSTLIPEQAAAEVKPQLPAIPVADLNAKIGLPK